MEPDSHTTMSVTAGCYLQQASTGKVFVVLWTGHGGDRTYFIDTEHTKKRRADHNAEFQCQRTVEFNARLQVDYQPEEDRLTLLEAGPTPPAVRRYSDPFTDEKLKCAAKSFGTREACEESYSRTLDGISKAEDSDAWHRLSKLLTFREPLGKDGKPPEPSIYSPTFAALLDGEQRAALIDAYCELTGETRWTIYRTFRAFCQGGLTPEAVVPEYDKCGVGERTYVSKPGPKNSISPVVGVVRDEIVNCQILMACERYLTNNFGTGKRRSKSIRDCVDWVVGKFLCYSSRNRRRGLCIAS
jgi:hypothetical protein